MEFPSGVTDDAQSWRLLARLLSTALFSNLVNSALDLGGLNSVLFDCSNGALENSFFQRVDVVISSVLSSSSFNGAVLMLHALPCDLLGGLRTAVVTVVWDISYYSSLEQLGRGGRVGEPRREWWTALRCLCFC